MIISIDGADYDVKCSVSREADVRDTEISGEMLDGSIFHDIEGTYYDYEIRFLFPLWDQAKYDAIYEALTAPVDGHAFILPYGQDVVAITAKVEPVADEMIEMETGYKYWRNTRFRISANHPTKQMDLGEVLTRGRTPLPDASSVPIGTTYTMTASGWQLVPDGSDMYF